MKNKNTLPQEGTERKHQPKKLISLLLVFALVVTGLFAFLTATDTKTNTFTIGNVDIALFEDDQYIDDNDLPQDYTRGDDDWYDHDTGDVANDTNNNDIPDFAENILPGQEVPKTPYVENTGTNEAWVYMVVKVPTAPVADLVNNNGTVAIAGESVNVDVTAYAIQDNYDNASTSAAVWTAYGLDLDGNATENANPDPQIFAINGLDTTNWTLLNSPRYCSSDGFNYYVYGLNNKLAAGAATDPLFTSVTLASDIGEQQPVGVAYYAPINQGGNSGTGAGEANVSALIPTAPAGYELVHFDEVTPGQSIGDLYWDDSLAVDGSTFEWAFADNANKLAYSGMTVTETTQLIPQYTTRTNNSASSYLRYIINPDSSAPLGRSASLSGLDSTAATYPSAPTDVVVPQYITVKKVAGPYLEGVDCVLNAQTSAAGFESLDVGDEVQIPVKEVNLAYNTSAHSVVQKLILSDSIETITNVRGCNNMEYVNIPYSCTTIGSNAFGGSTALESVTLHNNISTILDRAFKNCSSLEEATVPASVTTLNYSIFENCTSLRTLVLECNCTIPQALIDGCSSLETLIIKGGNISGSLAISQSGLTNLSYFYCNASSVPYEFPGSQTNNYEVVLGHNVQDLKNTYYDSSASCQQYNISVKYCGTEAEFRALQTVVTGSQTGTVEDHLTANPTQDLSHVTFNYTDPYAA